MIDVDTLRKASSRLIIIARFGVQSGDAATLRDIAAAIDEVLAVFAMLAPPPYEPPDDDDL